MLKVLWNILKKVFGVLLMVLSPLKRLVCRRKRRTSDTILPLTNHYPAVEDLSMGVNENSQVNDLQPWDSWEADDQSRHSNSNYTNSQSLSRNYHSRLKQQEVEEEPDVDYFKDMTPEFKKPAKILIKKKENINHSAISSKLAVSTDIPLVQNSDLGTWDDSTNAWEEEAGEDLSWEAEAAMKETRKAERQKRHLEQQKKKQEREMLKAHRKDGQFSTVRLS